MKRIIAVLCVAALAVSLLALAGCGSSKEIPADSVYIGTWKAVRAEIMGEEASLADELDGDWIFTLKADGTIEQTYEGGTDTGVWSITSKGIKVKIDGAKSAMKFTMENDELMTKIIANIYFAKQS